MDSGWEAGRIWPRYSVAALSLLGPLFLFALVTLFMPGKSSAGEPEVADNGMLTTWQLPSNRGPWQLKWDAMRNVIWFAEGNHSDPPLDQVGMIDPATHVLKEWGIPTNSAYVHGTSLDRQNNLWFTEVRINKIGRLQPDINTITEWTLDPVAFPHSVVVDDSVPETTTVWFSERDQDVISSLNLATNDYRRHVDPLTQAWPHSVVLAPDHSVWFVETCGNRVGQLVSNGTEDTWRFWQPPTPPSSCAPPNGIGLLFGNFLNGDFWYSEAYNGNIIRLQPDSGTFTIWRVPGAGNGAKLITQIGGDPDTGHIFFPEMNTNRLGRLEPQGASTPTVVAVTPVVVTRPAPPMLTALPASVVYTPIVTQLTPDTRVLTGTRTAGFTEWNLPRATASPGRYIGPARAWFGGGSYWASLDTADQVVRFTVSAGGSPTNTPTVTPTGTPTLSPTVTTTGTQTATPGAATNTPTGTATQGVPSSTATSTAQATLSATRTATPTLTPCSISFTDVQPGDYFYAAVSYLSCAGVVTGYSDGTFRPYNNTTRGQLSKIVVLAEGWPIDVTGGPHFTDVPTSNPFYPFIETAYNRGIISGYSDGTFRWGSDVTRGQLSKIVVLAEEWPIDVTGGPHFTDVPESQTFYAFVETAYNRGIISGYADGTFRPGNNATRGQISKIVYQAITQPGEKHEGHNH